MTDFIEVINRYPLYASLPDNQKLTPDDVLNRWPDATLPEQFPPAYINGRGTYPASLLYRVAHPEQFCPVAVQPEESGGWSRRWVPCRWHTGGAQCVRHGGIKKTKESMKVELDRLRRRVSELEDQPRKRTGGSK